MAQTTASRLPLFEDVRQSVKRMQEEGERLVGRIRHDARSFFVAQRNGRATVTSALTDVSKLRAICRQRAEQALKEIGSRRERVVATVEEQLARLTELTVKRLPARDTRRAPGCGEAHHGPRAPHRDSRQAAEGRKGRLASGRAYFARGVPTRRPRAFRPSADRPHRPRASPSTPSPTSAPTAHQVATARARGAPPASPHGGTVARSLSSGHLRGRGTRSRARCRRRRVRPRPPERGRSA